MHKIAIFASGSGTNAENLIKYFHHHHRIEITKVFSNKINAFVHERAGKLGIASETFDKPYFQSMAFAQKLKNEGITCIVLAGFLWLIPPTLIEAFDGKIINIHPSLLPDFGGRGMYGNRVHEAVIARGVKESGITIHLVNEEYDKGKILFQSKIVIEPKDNAETLANKIHQLEYEYYPKVVASFLEETKS